jgi:hypothetical protein
MGMASIRVSTPREALLTTPSVAFANEEIEYRVLVQLADHHNFAHPGGRAWNSVR